MQKKEQPKTATIRALAALPGRQVKWELLTDEELSRPGATLINLILTAATDRGIGMTKIAKEALDVSPSYFAQLRSGAKPVDGLGDKHIAKAARFLRMPVVSVKLAADQLKMEDFYAVPAAFEDYLLPALHRIQSHPEFGPLVPPKILKADVAIQKCLVLLYEEATGEVLIPGRVPKKAIVERHQSLVRTRIRREPS